MAGLRLVNEQVERDHDDDHRDDIDDGRAADRQAVVYLPRHILQKIERVALVLRTEGEQHEVLKKVADSDRGDEHRKGGGAAKRAVCDLLDGHAEHGADNYCKQNRYSRMQTERGRCGKCDDAAHHNDISVGEVQHFCDAVYHCISKGNKRIHTAEAYSVYKCGYKAHFPYPLLYKLCIFMQNHNSTDYYIIKYTLFQYNYCIFAVLRDKNCIFSRARLSDTIRPI